MKGAKAVLNRCREVRRVQMSLEAQGTRTPASPAGLGGCTEQVTSVWRGGDKAPSPRASEEQSHGGLGRKCKSRKLRDRVGGPK